MPKLHNAKSKKPQIRQIITSWSKERYVVDLIDVTPDINDKNKKFNYIMNIIDHHSKLLGLFLLEKKLQKMFYMVKMDSLVFMGNHRTYDAITVKNLK